MKKLILITALGLSLAGKLYAQDTYESPRIKQMKKSKTDQTFNANVNMINIRDFVVLKEGRMILELHDLSDYESFRNLDSLLLAFRKDVAFYKDSLDANATGSTRIDYVINPEYSFKKIRFKKYAADGNTFMAQGSEISKLKFDQDTVRIIMQKSRLSLGSQKCTIPYSIQATFVLGNYYDVDKVIADKVLAKIVDTLAKASSTKKTRKSIYNNPVSIIYNPYFSGKEALNRLQGSINSEYDAFDVKRRHQLNLNVCVGAGLVRNTMAPTGDIAIQFNKFWDWKSKDYDFLRLSVTPYFLFSKNPDGDFITNDNWFVNADIGSVYERNESTWLGKKISIGIGYLVKEKGGYFKNTTMKVFTDVAVVPRLTIVPEMIFTNNFKQIFPGITVKVF